MNWIINFLTENDVDIKFNIFAGATLDATSNILEAFGFQRILLL